MTSFTILRPLKLLFFRFFRVAVHHPGKILLAAVALLIFFGAQVPKLQNLLAIDDLIDSDFASYPQLKKLNESFTDKNSVFLTLTATEGRQIVPSKNLLCDLRTWVNELIVTRGDIKKIFSSFGIREVFEYQNGALYQKPLLTVDCSRLDIDESEKIRKGLEQIAASPWNLVFNPPGTNDIVFTFYLLDTATDQRFGAFDTKVVAKFQKSFETFITAKHPEIRAQWAGVGVFQYYLRIGFDITTALNGLMLLFLICMVRVSFGSWKSGAIFISSLFVTLTLVYGGMVLNHCPIDVLTNCLPLMLMIATIEDYWFVSHYLRGKPHHLWKKGFRKFMLPAFFTSLTTVIGFGSLALAPLGIIQRFGIWAATAAAIEWFVVFILLPAFLSRFPRFQHWIFPADRWPTRQVQQITRFSSEKTFPLALVAGLLLMIPIGIYGISKIRINDSALSVFKKDHVFLEAIRDNLKTRGWESEVSLIFEDFDEKEKNRKIFAEFKRDPNVAFVEDPYDIIDYLSKNLKQTKWEDMRDMWRQTPSGDRLIRSHGLARGILYLRNSEITEVNRMSEKVKSLCPNEECFLAGGLISYGEFGKRVLSTLMDSFTISIFLVALIILYLTWELKIQFRVATVLSAIWGPFGLLACFYLFNIPVFYITSIVLSVLIGLAGDNTIQFLFFSHRIKRIRFPRVGLAPHCVLMEDSLNDLGPASLQVTGVMIALASAFFLSYFSAVQTLGALMVLGFGLSVIGDLTLYRSLLKIFYKR